MAVALEVRDLWKGYAAGVRGCSARVWVLRGLSLVVQRGERVAVIGAHAAGKTTLAHCLCGLRRPDAGLIAYADACESPPVRIVDAHDSYGDPLASSTLLLVGGTEDVADRVDRVLLLQEGRLVPFDAGARVRRVAESALPRHLR